MKAHIYLYRLLLTVIHSTVRIITVINEMLNLCHRFTEIYRCLHKEKKMPKVSNNEMQVVMNARIDYLTKTNR